MLHPPYFVEKVIERTYGMAPGHSWTGETHDIARHLPLSWLVAVDRAIRASGFIRAIRALLESSAGISHQPVAIGAQESPFMVIMVLTAVDSRHANEGFVFAFQSAGEPGHEAIINALVIHLFDPNQSL